MDIERLKQLRAHIRKQPPERINMGNWFFAPGRFADLCKEFDKAREGNLCGTVGCIAGHACLIMPDDHLVKFKEHTSDRWHVDYQKSARQWLGCKTDNPSLFLELQDAEEHLSDKGAALARLDYAIACDGNFNLLKYLKHLEKSQRGF